MIPGSPSSDDSNYGGFNKLRRRKLSFRRRTEKGKSALTTALPSLGPYTFGGPKTFVLRSSWTYESLFILQSFLEHLCPDDADAGEIKKSHKSVRRRQKEAAVNQKQEEAPKRQWEAHRNSVSSHSSGDEVWLWFGTASVAQPMTIKNCC